LSQTRLERWFLRLPAKATLISAVVCFSAMGSVSAAAADPCNAIPDKGPAPAWIKSGARFSGVVRYVVDGDGFCVGGTVDPATWIEVRLADFSAPELTSPEGKGAKAVLAGLVFQRPVECIVRAGRNGRTISYDRVIAVCSASGRGLAAQLRAAGVQEGGN
jgi:hypothetical protein